jgi:hypothetical protein
MVICRRDTRVSSMHPSEGPDFLCVGMHKAGTQWLYDQLQGHPDFWMPPIKEIHYLERDDDRGRNAQYILEHKRSTSRPGATRRSEIGDPRDRAFLEDMAGHRGLPLSLDRYADLFRHKGNLLSGDITPQYGEIPEDIVAQVASRFPALKVILLVRDPVSRAWSHISQWHRQERFDARVLESPARFRAFVEGSKKLHKFSSATRVAERWQAQVGSERLRAFFLEDISLQPDRVRREVVGFLGGDPEKEVVTVEAAFNRKSGHRKLELSHQNEAVLAEFLKDEIRACAERFGGCARDWPLKYGF